jgi:signal peptidase I
VLVILRTFLIALFYVPSGSMETTLHGARTGGDKIAVNMFSSKIGYPPRRGEVVVFRDQLGWLDNDTAPEGSRTDGTGGTVAKAATELLTLVGVLPSNNEKDLVKRVIAIGGDEVTCVNHQVYVDGRRLVEPYVFAGDQPCGQPFTVRVPLGRLFVLGDHRSASDDSGQHLDGPFSGTVSQEVVTGRAVAVVLPLGRFHPLPVPRTFDQPFRTGNRHGG